MKTLEEPNFYESEAEAVALVTDLTTPAKLELFLQAIRARRSRIGLPPPAPSSLPIPIEIPQ